MPFEKIAESRPVASHTPALTALDPHSLLDAGEVAALLKVPISWVYSRTRKRSLDRLPGFRLGKYWRFQREDVLAWLARQRAGVRFSA
jgi:excisionase family DNA binding protein